MHFRYLTLSELVHCETHVIGLHFCLGVASRSRLEVRANARIICGNGKAIAIASWRGLLWLFGKSAKWFFAGINCKNLPLPVISIFERDIYRTLHSIGALYVTFFFSRVLLSFKIIFLIKERKKKRRILNIFLITPRKISFNRSQYDSGRIKDGIPLILLSSPRKRRIVTVFRHGTPEYCASALPAPVLPPRHLTEPSRVRLSVGVRERVAYPRDQVIASAVTTIGYTFGRK